jgi:tetraacyldisaccharide 4'-kinase
VISVGNLTFGGTGKTPVVIWLGRRLAERGARVAVLTRGYRRGRAGADEPEVIAASLPGARVLVDRDRHRAARRCLEGSDPPDTFLLDDGFQHWALRRDLDIVLLDGIVPFGLGRVFPAGLLREGLGALSRAHVAVVTRADLVPPERVSLLRSYLRTRFPHLVVSTAVERVTRYRDLTGRTRPRPHGHIVTACGVGNPLSFAARADREGLRAAGSVVFGDHHPWDPGDVASVEREAARRGAASVLTTSKDATKIDPAWVRADWLVMEIETVLATGERDLMERVERARAGGARGCPAPP